MTQKPPDIQEPQERGGEGGAFRRLFSVLNAASLALLSGGVLALVAALLTALLLPNLASYTLTLGALGLFLLLLFLVVAFQSVKTAFLGRRGRYGSNAVVMVLAFAGLMVLANVIGARNAERIDITASKLFTLAQRTQEILKGLGEPVEARGFFTQGDPLKDQAETLLKGYRQQSPQFSYRFVDPEAEPGVARQFGVNSADDYRSVVFSAGTRRLMVRQDNLNEQEFTGAILSVTGLELKRVRFLAGHDERDPASFIENGMGEATRGLQRDNYQALPLNLTADPDAAKKLSSETAVLVIAGPRKDLLDPEKQLLDQYLRGGGKLLVLLDPNPPASFVDLLKKWAIGLVPGTAVDRISYVSPDRTVPVVQRGQFVFDTITKQLDTAFFPAASSFQSLIKEIKRSDTVRVFPIALTSPQSWMAKDPKQTETPQQGDVLGPLGIAIGAEGIAPYGEQAPATQSQTRTRIIAIGDSDFATNQYFYSLGNSDLFLNSVNWLAEQESLVSIRPKPSGERIIIFTQSEFRYILWSSIALLPLVLVVVGGIVWWRRR